VKRRRWAWRDDDSEHLGSRPPRPLSEALSEVAADLQLDEPEIIAGVMGGWAGMVGEAVAAHARPRSVRQGVLTVEVDSPEWATQLRYLEGELLLRIGRKVRPGAVTGLRLVVRR
jgi:Zn-ribbon-containing, possibly RNA-binding protein and truncated derivatives